MRAPRFTPGAFRFMQDAIMDRTKTTATTKTTRFRGVLAAASVI